MARAKKAAVAEAEPVTKVLAIKGLNADFACAPNGTPFQFEVGKTYRVEGKIEACRNGFHAVDMSNPLHVWDFYPVIGDDGRLTRYAEVELSGAMDREEEAGGTKIAAAEITVKVELSLPDFIKRAVTALLELAKGGKDGDTVSSGDSATLAASGHYATLAASGDSATLAASGHYAKLAASGDYATLAASGHYAKLAASGNYAKLVASGKDSVIAASGSDSVAFGAEGTWIALPEYRGGKCVGFATGCIGQDGLKPNTPYRAKDGKLVEVA